MLNLKIIIKWFSALNETSANINDVQTFLNKLPSKLTGDPLVIGVEITTISMPNQ